MELTKRPFPQIPWEPSELAMTVRARYNEGLAALEEVFLGVREAESSWRSAPKQWKAKEVLAHLIRTERHWLEDMDDSIGGFPHPSDDWAGNCTLNVRATVAAY